MGSGLIRIVEVTGTSPNFQVTLANGASIAVGDHIVAPLEGLPVGDGAPFRVSNVVSAVIYDVVDDLNPDGGTYGSPSDGDCQFYTPTPNLGLAQSPDNAPYWGEPLRRNAQILDKGAVVKFTTEADLLASSQDDGVIAYAIDTATHYVRQGGSWEVLVAGAQEDRVGWVRIVDVQTQSGQPTSARVYADPPNNTILQSVASPEATIEVVVESSFPIIDVNGVVPNMPLVGSIYRGTASLTLAAAGDVVAEATSPDGDVAAADTVAVALDLPPTITALSFTGGYPGSQTELKEDDEFDIEVTADKAFDRVEILNYEAGQSEVVVVPSGTNATVTLKIADRGNTAVLRPARVRVRDAVTAAYSTTRDTNQGGGSVNGTDVVNCNNLAPSISIGTVTYPGAQQALKGSESATVVNTVSNYDTVVYDSPNSDLSISNSTSFENPKSVQRIGGSYNISTNNFRISANRAANNSTTVVQDVVNIANVAATVTVSEPSRLRSGGNDGTSAQNHTVTIASTQQLLSAPSLDPDSGGSRGTFIGSWSGGPTSYTRSLQVHDNDEKGTFNWENLIATNLAGIVTSAISGDSQYILGGFVSRTVTWQAFQTISDNLNVEIADFNKIQAGLFSATNQQSTRYPIGTSPPEQDGYTSQDPVGTKPHNVEWLDTTAAGSNTGEAYLFDYEEVI